MDDESYDLDLLASSLQADGGDVRFLLKALVTRLSGALGDRLTVQRSGGLLRRSGDIRKVTVHLGDETLDATVEGGSLECTVARSSGGIRIRSARVTVDEWLHRLLAALRAEAATSSAARSALESIMLGGQT
jgi:hypothetical protein